MSYIWDVTRVTTDKLQEELNELAWEVYQLQYVGGRDWVLISREPDRSMEIGPRIYQGTARRLGQSDLWTIHVQGVGTVECERAVDIDHEATALVMASTNLRPEDFRVDIDVNAARDLD